MKPFFFGFFMKRPSFQFYPSDWLRDTALRSCSTGARGLWIDMICYMHEGTPYGHLKVKDKVILPDNLARMCGLTCQEVEGWLLELKSSGVYEIDEDGSIYSRRMIRDENLRMVRSAGGKLGGNPNLKVNLQDNHKVEKEVNQILTPSSASSSASSSSFSSINKEKKQRGSRLPTDFVLHDEWMAFCQQERSDLNVHKTFDAFKDYWIAKAGSGGVKLDWFATWRNWIRNQSAVKQSTQQLTFAERDEMAKRKRWEERTGRKWDDDENNARTIDASFSFLEIEQ